MTNGIEYISSENAPPPGGHYSQAAAAGPLVFISGQLPVAPDGSHRPDVPFDEQAHQALTNLLAVAAAAGCGPRDIVKVTAYIVGVENWPPFNRIYGTLFGLAKPARAVVPVPELHYGYLVEVEAVAMRAR